MKALLAIFFITAAGCATYNAQLVSATSSPRGGAVAVTFNEYGEEKAKRLAKFVMRKFCSGSGYEVTSIQMTQEANSASTIVHNPILKTNYLVSNARADYSNQPIVNFQCKKENPTDSAELDL